MGKPASDRQRPLTPAIGDGDALTVALAVADAGTRLDRVLMDRLGEGAGLSRTRLQSLIAGGHVQLDGRLVTSAGFKVPGVGEVLVAVPPVADARPVAQAVPFRVVFEDAELLVLDKPAGLVVHPAAGHADGTLVNGLLAHCGDSLSGIGGVRRPGIVHRLDKDTSGLMVVAKTDAAHQGLTALFADHGRTRFLDRRYLAVVWGTPATPAGSVDRPLGRHVQLRDRMSVVAAARGRAAVTRWTILERFAGASLLECRLETGRTHQIRVHMTHAGHPLIGDPVYGAGYRTKVAHLGPAAAAKAAAFPRQALHAATLGFVHPATGAVLTFSSPAPDDVTALLEALRSEPG